MKTLFIIIGIILLLIVIGIAAFVMIARQVHKHQGKIKSEKGIQEKVVITINGIRQELCIRGKDSTNPVILFLHGGPGSPTGYLDYTWQPYLLSDYTFVTYDQRGSGRTYFSNPKAEVSEKLILEDIDLIVDYLRKHFQQDRVILMGHSWGTLIGCTYAYNHPDKLSTYFGIGQMVDTCKGEEIAFKEAIRLASEQKDTKYIEKIQTAYEAFCQKRVADKDFLTFRNMETKYILGKREKKMSVLVLEALTSPDITYKDLKWFLGVRGKIVTAKDYPLMPLLFQFQAKDMIDYQVPMCFISGGDDYITPFELVQNYSESIHAPSVKMVIIDGTGHNPYMDTPQEFADVVNDFIIKNRKIK